MASDSSRESRTGPRQVSADDLPADIREDPEKLERVLRIMRSDSYTPAERDLELLASGDLTAIRLLLEFIKPQLALAERNINSTIVLFGGTRILEPAVARKRLDDAVAARAAGAALGDAGDAEHERLDREVRVAERIAARSHFYDVAREFARLVSRAGQNEDRRDYVIVTGGGPGIMEAGNRGADDVGAQSIGLNITLPQEQVPNPYITPDLCFQFHYFAIRKMHFLRIALALVAFPGGFGTLDELFDTLCLIQTRKMEPVPVILVGEEFWRGVIDFEQMEAEGVIAPRDRELFTFAETAEQIRDAILDWYGIEAFASPTPETLAERRRMAAAELAQGD